MGEGKDNINDLYRVARRIYLSLLVAFSFSLSGPSFFSLTNFVVLRQHHVVESNLALSSAMLLRVAHPLYVSLLPPCLVRSIVYCMQQGHIKETHEQGND